MKKIITLFAAVIAVSMIVVVAFPETILIFQPGERKNIWLEIEERDDLSFTIDTAVYEIFHDSGSVESAKASATISGDRIYGDVDATGWTEGSEYRVWFYWGVSETSEDYINIIRVSCGEEWE